MGVAQQDGTRQMRIDVGFPSALWRRCAIDACYLSCRIFEEFLNPIVAMFHTFTDWSRADAFAFHIVCDQYTAAGTAGSGKQDRRRSLACPPPSLSPAPL